LGAAAGIGLDEVSSPGGGDPTFLTEPSREMAVVEVFGSDPRGPFPEHVLWETAESLSGGHHPCSVHKFLPLAQWDEYFPEDVQELVLVGFWGYVTAPKPNVYVFYNEKTMFLPDGSRDPFGIPQPVGDPMADIVWEVVFHGEDVWFVNLAQIAGDAGECDTLGEITLSPGDGSCLLVECIQPWVVDVAFVEPLSGSDGWSCGRLAQWAGQYSSNGGGQ